MKVNSAAHNLEVQQQVALRSPVAKHASTPAVKQDVSPLGEVMNQLRQVQQNEPARFKDLMAEGAEKLEASGNPELKKLAESFSTASETGQLPPIVQRRRAEGSSHPAKGQSSAYERQKLLGPPPDLAGIIQSLVNRPA